MGGKVSMEWRILGKLVRGSEKKRSVNPVNNRIVGEVFSLQDVHAAVFDIVFRDADSRGRPRNLANKHQSRQHHPHFHGKGQIGHDGSMSASAARQRCPACSGFKISGISPIAHVVRHNHQNRRPRQRVVRFFTSGAANKPIASSVRA